MHMTGPPTPTPNPPSPTHPPYLPPPCLPPDIYDEFVAKATERAQRRVVGDPFEDGTEQGPQIDQDQLDKVRQLAPDPMQSCSTFSMPGAAASPGAACWA